VILSSKCSQTEITVHFNFSSSDLVTSSINLDTDWSVVSWPPELLLMRIVQYVHMNKRQAHVGHLQYTK